MKKALLILLILLFVFPIHCLKAEDRGDLAPKNFDESLFTFKSLGENIKEAPKGFILIWHKAMDPIFNFLGNRVWPPIKNSIKKILQGIKNWFLSIIKPEIEKEIEERKPTVKKELEKETEELKEDTSKIKTETWSAIKEWFKDIIDNKKEESSL